MLPSHNTWCNFGNKHGRDSPMSRDLGLINRHVWSKTSTKVKSNSNDAPIQPSVLCPLGRLDYKATPLPQIHRTTFGLWSYTILVGQLNFRIVQATEMAPKIKLQTKQCFEHLLNIFDKGNFHNDKANSSILGPPSYFFEFKLVRFDFLWFEIKF